MSRRGRVNPPARVIDLPMEEIVAALESWYALSARPLPRRSTADPYPILVSEIMLQQTRVETVLAFYGPFLARFPKVSSLAAAREEDVLKAWEGLGYYRRAKLLHAASKMVVEAGEWPGTVEGLMGLPGVGRTTAGAVASFAFGLPAPILDGNVKRLWCRLAAYGEVPSGAALAPLWALSAQAVRSGEPARVNQALMELGATLCARSSPRCGHCPLSAFCSALAKGEQKRFPLRASKRARPLVDVSVGLIWREGTFLVARRVGKRFLGGLWELPGGKWEPGEDGEAALRRELREELGVEVHIDEAHPPVRHGYTHFEVRLHPFTCSLGEGGEPRSGAPLRWIEPRTISELAFPSGTHKVFERVLAEDRAHPNPAIQTARGR